MHISVRKPIREKERERKWFLFLSEIYNTLNYKYIYIKKSNKNLNRLKVYETFYFLILSSLN